MKSGKCNNNWNNNKYNVVCNGTPKKYNIFHSRYTNYKKS